MRRFRGRVTDLSVLLSRGRLRYHRARLPGVVSGVAAKRPGEQLGDRRPSQLGTAAVDVEARVRGGGQADPKMDAHLEPWTILGYLAGHNKIGWMRLGVAVTDAGRRNP